MTEPPTAAERPITFEVWHPSLADVMASRPRLLEAWLEEPAIREHVRQLNVVLVALSKVTTRDLELGEQLLADPTILPTDADLVERAHLKLHLQRSLELGATAPVRVHDLPMGGCSTAAEHYRHLDAGDPKCENQR